MMSVALTEGSIGDTVRHPMVSIIIPFFKQDAFLPSTVASALNCGYKELEVIVVDDGSPTPAASLLSSYQNVQVIRTQNRGVNAARNLGFRNSSGRYLLFLDSDDLLVPGAIESHLEMFAQEPDAALSFGAVSTIDAQGRQVRPPHVCRPRRDYFLMLLEGNPIAAPGAALIRRAAFIEAGLFDEKFRMAEDYLMYLQLARRHRLLLNQTCVLHRRIHDTNVSKDIAPMMEATMAALDRIELDYPLTRRERQRLAHGRRRWQHEFQPKETLIYHLGSMYFRLRAMLMVSPVNYLPNRLHMWKEYL